MFRDPASELAVADRGFVDLQLLMPGDVDRLLSAYWSTVPAEDEGLTVDFMRHDRALVRTLSGLVREVVTPRLDAVFDDYQIVMTTFVAKYPGYESEMFLHDDRTFVDERLHRSLTVWTPLVDVGPESGNGALQVVPRSHRLPGGWAGSLTPELFRWYEQSLREMAVRPALPAGRSLAYDSRLLHSSGANLTDSPRVAAVVAVAPRAAKLIHVVGTGRRGRSVYGVDPAFYTDFHPRDTEQQMPPNYQVVERYSAVPEVDDQLVDDALGQHLERRIDCLVPYDLRYGTDQNPLGALGSVVGRGDAPDRDIAQVSADLPVTPLGVVEMPGSPDGVGATSCWNRGRLSASLPESLSEMVALGARRHRGAADLLLLDPGSRCTLSLPEGPNVATGLWVVEAPTWRAGVRDGSGARVFEPGDEVSLTTSHLVTLWNDGPGPLVLVAFKDPVPFRRRLGRWLRRG